MRPIADVRVIARITIRRNTKYFMRSTYREGWYTVSHVPNITAAAGEDWWWRQAPARITLHEYLIDGLYRTQIAKYRTVKCNGNIGTGIPPNVALPHAAHCTISLPAATNASVVRQRSTITMPGCFRQQTDAAQPFQQVTDGKYNTFRGAASHACYRSTSSRSTTGR